MGLVNVKVLQVTSAFILKFAWRRICDNSIFVEEYFNGTSRVVVIALLKKIYDTKV